MLQKLSITSLLDIYKRNVKEGRDEETIEGQIKGEILAQTKNFSIANKLGTIFLDVLKKFDAVKGINSKKRIQIDNELLFKYPDNFKSSFRHL